MSKTSRLLIVGLNQLAGVTWIWLSAHQHSIGDVMPASCSAALGLAYLIVSIMWAVIARE